MAECKRSKSEDSCGKSRHFTANQVCKKGLTFYATYTIINKNGAILILSTHYPSLMDEFDRNDNACIIRNEDGISVKNLASRFIRNDIKKSVAYESNFLNGTAPSYEAVMDYKRFLRGEIQ